MRKFKVFALTVGISFLFVLGSLRVLLHDHNVKRFAQEPILLLQKDSPSNQKEESAAPNQVEESDLHPTEGRDVLSSSHKPATSISEVEGQSLLHNSPIPSSLYRTTSVTPATARRIVSKYSMIKFFLMFIGYPRSGSTILGSLLDAHPHIIIANEYDLSKRWISWPEEFKRRNYVFDQLLNNSFYEATENQRAPRKNMIFDYHVPHQWQGTFDGYIEVIGDKKGGATAKRIARNSHEKLIAEIRKVLQVQIKFIHVVRNPFDVIATMALRAKKVRGFAYDHPDFKLQDNAVMQKVTKLFFKLANANHYLRQRYGENVLDVNYSLLLKRPKKTLKKICKFLDIRCTKYYLNSCAKKLFRNETRTRKNISWSKMLQTEIMSKMKAYNFFKDFKF